VAGGGGRCWGGGGQWWLILAVRWPEQWVGCYPLLCFAAMHGIERESEGVFVIFLSKTTYGYSWLVFKINMAVRKVKN